MDTHPLLTPPAELLRTQVVAAVKGHLVRPAPSCPLERRSPADVAGFARQALDAILTRQFRVGPLPAEPVYDELLDRVQRRVRRGERIFITVGYGPLKNQNAVSYSRADWAELFALTHLAAMHNKVQAVYPPGLQFRIVFDDSTLIIANRVDRRLINSYVASIGTLIHALGYQGLFLPTLRQSAFSWILNFGFYQVAARRVQKWEADPANREKLEQMHASARRNLDIPPALGAEATDRYVADAAHRYRVYWEALQLSGLTRSRRRIVGMYLDGTQHHIPQTVALHLTTLDKGQVTQPWQGEGMLLDNGHGRLEPFVMTAGRRPRYQTHVIDGLDSVPLPGFDQISVAVAADK
jgi:hypothetical protein